VAQAAQLERQASQRLAAQLWDEPQERLSAEPKPELAVQAEPRLGQVWRAEPRLLVSAGRRAARDAAVAQPQLPSSA
jgi:hypothetical protein